MVNALFINTRPTHRSDALNHLDVPVANLPLLAINDLSPTTSEQAAMHGFCQNNPYKALIVTSVESAKRATNYLKNQGFDAAQDLPNLTTCPIIAVGLTTANILQEFGFSVILPTTANNEGMLKLAAIRQLNAGDKVMIWRGMGGRRLLHDDLTARGIAIDAITWYQRVAPPNLKNTYHAISPLIHQAIHTCTPVFILITSQTAFIHWQNLRSPHAHRLHYLTLGERLFNIVKNTYPTTPIHLLNNLNPIHIQEQLSIICRI